MKKQRIELFILNLFYEDPETSWKRRSLIDKCKKAFPKSSSSIGKHIDRLIKERFIVRTGHGHYRLPNRKTKQGKQYNAEPFLKRIIKTYDLKENFWLYDREEHKNIFYKDFPDVVDPSGKLIAIAAILRNNAIDPEEFPLPSKIPKKKIIDDLFFSSMHLILTLHQAKTKAGFNKRKREKVKELEECLSNLSPRSPYYQLLFQTKEYLNRPYILRVLTSRLLVF